jgi:hypothetical protein
MESSSNKIITAEKMRFLEYLKIHSATCTQVAKVLNIDQKNCTRYKRKFQQQGLLAVIKIVRCPHTGFNNVQLLTSNGALFPKTKIQLDLWEQK